MSRNENVETTESGTAVRSAGAFDVRSIIGGLLGVYGVILIVVGLWFTSDADKAKADGENLNTIVGVGLLVFAVLMIGWVVLRPLKVPVEEGAVLD